MDADDFLLVLERIDELGLETNQSAEPEKCHLLSLPNELRNAIYEMVLLEPAPISVKPKARRTKQTHNIQMNFHADTSPVQSIFYAIPLPPLALTCRQVRDETLPMFFGANEFIFSAPVYLAKAPMSFSNVLSFLRHAKKFNIKISHEHVYGCHTDHIYEIDISADVVSSKLSHYYVRRPKAASRADTPSHCYKARYWSDALERVRAGAAAKSGLKGDEPTAEHLSALLAAIRLEHFW